MVRRLVYRSLPCRDQPEPAEQGEDGADVKHAGALSEQEPLPRGLLAPARAAGNSHHNLRETP